jgi:hypothetical protein
MARPHSLMLWSVVFAFLAAASLCAAEAKEAKPKHAKAPAARTAPQQSDDPFAGPEERSVPAAKAAPHRSDDPFARREKRAAPSAKKPARAVVKALRPGENVTRIEAALASPTELDFVETPLQEVIDYLKTQYGIEIQLDAKAVDDVGIGTDVPVTVDLKGISLRSALNLVLRRLNLTWTIEDEVLMITTPEEAENRLDTRVYDVADLVACRDDHDVPWDDYDTLIDTIASTIKPRTWEMEGGPGSIKGATLGTARVLVVSQTRDVQDEIVSLLKGIREIAKRNPNAGAPRRNRPSEKTSPAKPRLLTGEGSHDGAPTAAAPKKAADAGVPTQEKQRSMPEPPKGAPKGAGSKGMF